MENVKAAPILQSRGSFNGKIWVWLAVAMWMSPKLGLAANVTCNGNGSGVTYTTFAAAVSATGGSGRVTITGPVTETTSPNSNGPITVVTSPANSPQTIYINASAGVSYRMNGSFWTVTNVAFVHSKVISSNAFQFMNGSTTTSSTFTNCDFVSKFADDIVNVADVIATFNACDFVGGTTTTAGLQMTNAGGGVTMINCTVTDVGNGAGYEETVIHTNTFANRFYFCDFVNNLYGLKLLTGTASAAVTNCILISTSTSSTSEINSGGAGTHKPSADYCTFKTSPTGGNPTLNLGGNNNISTAAAEFVSGTVGSEDLHLKYAAQSVDQGVSITGIATDHDGNAQSSPPDIGCYAYFGATVPTATFTPTPTPSATATPIPIIGTGLGMANRLYDLEYIPCPVTTNSFEGDVDLDSNVQTIPKNTMRWRVKLNLSKHPTDSKGNVIGYHIIETRMGTAAPSGSFLGGNNPFTFHTGEWSAAGSARVTLGDDLVTFAEGVTVDPQNLSRTYVWVGDPAPYSEKYQFQGDPRYCPYADVKNNDNYNRYYGFSSCTTIGYGAFDKAVAVAGWNSRGATVASVVQPNGNGYGGSPMDIPRFHEYYRAGFLKTGAVFSLLNGWCTYYSGIGGEFGGDQPPISKSVSCLARPWEPAYAATSIIAANEISGWSNSAEGGMRLVSKWSNSVSNSWHAAPWLGELFPDDAYETCWKQGSATKTVGGNLPLNTSLAVTLGGTTSPVTFYKAPYGDDPVTCTGGINMNFPMYTSASHPRTIWSEKGEMAAPSFFLGNITGGSGDNSYFQQNGLNISSPLTLTVSTLGVNLGIMFNYPVPNTVEVDRPFGLGITGAQNLPDEWADTNLTHNILSIPLIGGTPRVFYPTSDTNHPYGMGTMKVQRIVSAGVTQSFMTVLNGLMPSADVGQSVLGKIVLIQLMRGFFDGGMWSGVDHITQVPLVTMVSPQNSGVVKAVANSIPVTWSLSWTRWGGSSYTEEYPANYTTDSSVTMSYVPMYNDKTTTVDPYGNQVKLWHYLLSPSDTTIGDSLPTGTLPSGALASQVIINTTGCNWDVSALSPGSYTVRVEAYRNGYQQHHSYHQSYFTLQK